MKKRASKILVLDIETAPTKAYVWGLWKQNIGINMIDRDWYMLSWAAKWLGDGSVMANALPDYKRYELDKENDVRIVRSIWKMLDRADVVIAHNGKRFDIPKLNARFLYHGMKPPSPYKVVDTLQTARAAFKFTSNKLDYLAQHLGVGKKIDTGGFELWEKCMKGDRDAWEDMVEYNIADVMILEDVYMKLRPWIKPHPNLGLYTDSNEMVCPTCGSSHVHKRGHYYTNVGRYQRYNCTSCGAWSKERVHNLPKKKRKNILGNVAA